MTESFEMSPYWTELICQTLFALVQGQEALKKKIVEITFYLGKVWERWNPVIIYHEMEHKIN